MSEEELRKEYDVFVMYYWFVPFFRIPKRFIKHGVYGMRLINFEEFKRMM